MSTIEISLSDSDKRDIARYVAEEMRKAGTGRKSAMSVRELAATLGVSPQTIYERVEAGIIRKVPDIGAVRIPLSEVERLTGTQQ
jgi:excisionase family DNA binding protein